MVSTQSKHSNLAWLAVPALLIGAIVLLTNTGVLEQPASQFAAAPVADEQVYDARSTKSTLGLLRQTAEHLSRMEGGASVGGFPGFEPPKDDKEYKRKIQEQDFSAQNVNDWVKDINGFLEQIVKKNPGRSLARILQDQGKTPIEIEAFVEALRNVHASAAGMQTIGVDPVTVESLEGLMQILKVGPW